MDKQLLGAFSAIRGLYACPSLVTRARPVPDDEFCAMKINNLHARLRDLEPERSRRSCQNLSNGALNPKGRSGAKEMSEEAILESPMLQRYPTQSCSADPTKARGP